MKRNRRKAAGNKISRVKANRPENKKIVPLYPPAEFESISRRKLWLTVLALFIISLTLNTISLNWGMPCSYSWSPDSIAGFNTVGSTLQFSEWKIRYPKGQLFIASIFYKPLLDHWEIKFLGYDERVPQFSEISADQFNILFMISRSISAVMGALTVVVVFLTGRLLFNDYLCGVLSGLSLAFTQLFVFYAHLGNVDVPTFFWFALAFYFAVKIVYIGKWRSYLLFGFCCAYSVCTKDPTAGFIIGLAVAMWIAMTGRGMTELGMPFKKAAMLLFNRRTIGAILTGALVFALLNDLLVSPSSFVYRMSLWIGSPIALYQPDEAFGKHLRLLKHIFYDFHYALGWPMLYATIISLVYCAIRYRWKFALGILPLVAFYFIVIIQIQMSVSRFYIPAFAGFAILVGKFFADILRWKKLPAALRVVPVCFVFVLSLLYCIALDLEMAYETRYDAEEWLKENVGRECEIAGLGTVSYLPRIHHTGRKSIFYHEKNNKAMLDRIRSYTDYLVLGEKQYTDSKYDKEFLKDLLDGQLGYTQVATFENKFLYPKKTIWGVAGWPRPRYSLVSPKIIVLKKNQEQSQH